MSLTRDTYINTPSPIEKELKAIFDTQESLIIFDIGSCEGEDSIKYSKIFPKSQIYAVEKPFTIHSREALQLIKLAKQKEKLLAVYHNRRYVSDYLTIKKILDKKCRSYAFCTI